MPRQHPFALNRRAFLGSSAAGLGSLALAHLLSDSFNSTKAESKTKTATSVICLFQHGGPSQVDMFDPKPALTKYHGQPFPGDIISHNPEESGNVLGSPFEFSPAGKCGMELSSLVPHLAKVADHLTLIRSMTTGAIDHSPALKLINTGSKLDGMPSMGAWTVYGLGSGSENLPAYVALLSPNEYPILGEHNWSSGWLPPQYSGTPFHSGQVPVVNLATPAAVPPAARQDQLDFIRKLNEMHLDEQPGNSELESRIRDFEVAAGMQTAVPEVADLSGETEETQQLYGLDNPFTEEYGRRCLLARRLVERGVRYVHVLHAGQPWDTHNQNNSQHETLCGVTDQPSAALVEDLARHGLLDSTIVLWCGEFGRLPVSQVDDGRDHNPFGFSLWVAGGPFKRGYIHGATDEFGYKAVEDEVSVHDFHATMLAALGLDHEALTFPFMGRKVSLTDPEVTYATVVDDLLA